MPDWQAVAAELGAHGVRVDRDTPPRATGGGDISAAWRLATADGAVFVKTGPPAAEDMFQAESEGLAAIAATRSVRVPRPVCTAAIPGGSFVAMEWLDLSAADAAGNRALGGQLAALHRHTADTFGWHRDNTIGRTPQPNRQVDDWTAFYREQRLRHQLRLADANGYGGALQADGERLLAGLDALFDGYRPQPSLLHGDLWGGNWAVSGGHPVIFDPATYYGDRETDLAMTRLFGGFSGDFYAAYEAAWPLADGADRRLPLYQLYHVLNHLNLFGSGYLARARALLAELLLIM
ncbi:MAG: fructosamine kinase family protein [Woeseiaceae bacterium]|nr:fructosamine kinase family protein [Woeseiaceae bacterium]